MLKLNMGWNQERLAQQVGFGLSEGNLERLPSSPIPIIGQEIQIDANFVIFGTDADDEVFKRDFEAVMRQMSFEPDGNYQVLNLDKTFFVIPVPQETLICFFIGLHQASYDALRRGTILSFRARMISGEGQNVEVNIFWKETEEEMMRALNIHQSSSAP